MAISDSFAPAVTDGSLKQLPPRTQVLADDGAITIADGVVFITKATAAAITIADPPAGMNGARLLIQNIGGAASTITYTAGFAGTTTSSDVATCGGAKTDSMEIVAYGGAWYATNLYGITLG